MKKIFYFYALIFLLYLPAAAQDPFSGFQELVTRDSIKPFTKDLGSVLGAATFHSGRSLGFSGFDIGIRGGLQLRPGKRNAVLRGKGVKTFGLPWVQAEIGLPFRLDGYIRGVSYQGLTISGGGLRYGIRKSAEKPLSPQFLVAWSGHSVSHKDFAGSHLGANLITSIMIKNVTPYVGAGVDRTRIRVRAAPLLDPGLADQTFTTTEARFTAGASVRPKAYLYLHAAYTMTHGTSGFDTGIGIRF